MRFSFPNTVCAKFNNGIGPRELKREGAAKQAAYYDKLRLITYGPMIAADRWTAIWKMHRGAYNGLIDYQRYRYATELEIGLSGVFHCMICSSALLRAKY